MRHLILTGACYVDTILDVPHYPQEDAKLRATAVRVRRGGNCPNSLEVLQQLLAAGDDVDNVATYLVSCLPEIDAPATQMIIDSMAGPAGSAEPPGTTTTTRRPNCDHCLYRAGHTTPASSYIVRAAATGSRTIVNHNALPEMTAAEFAGVVSRFEATTAENDNDDDDTWWHFEGRVPDVTLACIQHLRRRRRRATVSVEVEKPQRAGLRALAAEADVVFYSKTWAEVRFSSLAEDLPSTDPANGAQDQGYASAEACVQGEAAQTPRARLLFCTTVGAGDTFVAGVLYKLACQRRAPAADVDIQATLAFAVDLATRKVHIDGFQGLAGG
ncbi:hypothetical protein SPI_05554 [Niveomyces insectorum RCEF 264]|uniref:Ketohexokinase n=1 Tax=Niveomyces insectorum RCEF 264 TaxID=1081102 RepID=A0A167TBQ8_9HYPO|nr:hypothetical protein SPI_05554 [Niveomyces insectorum RCEF 264]